MSKSCGTVPAAVYIGESKIIKGMPKQVSKESKQYSVPILLFKSSDKSFQAQAVSVYAPGNRPCITNFKELIAEIVKKYISWRRRRWV